MAGRPAKTLADHIREGSYRPGRHGHLLAGPALSDWPAVAALQAAYREAQGAGARGLVERELAQLIRTVHAERDRRGRGDEGASLAASMTALGRPGSFAQLERFFPRYLRHEAGERAGEPFRLEPFQRDFLREFWRRDKQGRRLYSVGLLGIPKGNGKTPLAAGLGLFSLLTQTDAPEVYGIAGSKDQAGIALRFANRWAEESELSTFLKPGSGILRCRSHNGFYKLLSSDGRLGQGVNPSAAIVDEWWLFQTQREREAYNALARSLMKRGAGRSWLLAITTAGFDSHGQLGETYGRAINHPALEHHRDGYLRLLRDTDSGFLFAWYGLPEGLEAEIENPAVVRACNPASWLDAELLVRDLKRADTNEADWRRLHLNQWTPSRDAWLPNGCWARLRSDLELAEKAELYLGVDIAIRHDTSAVAWASRLEDGRIHLGCHTWAANPDAKAHQHLPGGEIRLELIEEFILELSHRYRIREVAYDPQYFTRSAQLLQDRGLTMVEYLQGSRPMVEATQVFYQACKEGRLTHDGDPVLAAHIDGAAAYPTEGGWKLRKLNPHQHIDACIAAVLAHNRAHKHKPASSPQIFWMEA